MPNTTKQVQPTEVRNARELTKAIDSVPTQPVAEKHTPQPAKAEKKTMASKKNTKRSAQKRAVSRKVPTNHCNCGCGALTRGNFAPGHDQRLVGMIKRGELKSLTAFQAQFAKSHGIKLGEKRPAPKKASTKAKGEKRSKQQTRAAA